MGFLGMEKDADGRDNSDSDRALVNTGAGHIIRISPSVSSWLNIGNDGSSLPGR